MEKTFVMIKPDGVNRGLTGEIIKRLEDKGLRITNIKKVKLGRKECFKLYGESFKKFPNVAEAICNYMQEGLAIAIIFSGEDAIKKARDVRGLSDPSKSPIGSVRRDFAGDQKMDELTKESKATKNVMHSSGTIKEAEEEMKLFFGKNA